MYKVSVIVPIYGVEKYIERCATSLLEQTLDPIELIFVNDCTQDNSISILEKILSQYPEKKNDVKIIHHISNKGLPQARRTGIINSNGEYIAHCDSDDWVCYDAYEKLYSFAKQGEFDIVSCNYYKSDESSHVETKYQYRTTLLQGPVWNKLVRRSLYKSDIKYPISNKAEDGALMAQLSFYATNIAHIDEALYYYYNNPSSMTRELSEEKILERFYQEVDNTRLRLEFLDEHDAIIKYKDDITIFKSVARNNLLPLIGKFKYFRLWVNSYPEINLGFLNCREASMINKIEHLFTLLGAYKLYCSIIKFLRSLIA